MLTLSPQQIEPLNVLMTFGDLQSENELFNEMLANFEYQQQLRELRKSIHAGLNSRAFEEVKDIPAFFASLKNGVGNG